MLVAAPLLAASCALFNDTSDSGQKTEGAAAETVYEVPVKLLTPFVSEEDESRNARTVIPVISTANFPVKRYVISAVCTSDTAKTVDPQTFTKDRDAASITTVSTVKMNLKQGTWTLTVSGYAAETAVGGESPVCTGCASGIVVDSDGNSAVTISVNPTDGSGSIALSVKPAGAAIKGMKALLYSGLAAEDSTTLKAQQTFSGTSLVAAGCSVTFPGTDGKAASFASGAYTLELYCYSTADISTATDAAIIFHRTETVYVWNGFTTDHWIDHYTLGSSSAASQVKAAVLSALEITDAMLAGTDTAFTKLTVPGSSTSSSRAFTDASSFGTYARYTCGASDTPALAVTVTSGKTVTVTDAAGTAVAPTTIMKDSTTYSSTVWILTYLLAAASANDFVTVKVTAQNGIASQSFIVAYGPEYVDNAGGSGSDSTGRGTREAPYATIAKAVDMLPSASSAGTADANNRITLLSNVTANTADAAASPADGTSANNALVSFTAAASGAPLVLTIDGGGSAGTAQYALDASSLSSDRVLYINNAYTTLTLSSVKITGGKSSGNGGGVYIGAGTLNLNDGTAVTSNTAATGGGIYIAGGTVNMCGSVAVSDNTATSSGAQAYLVDGTFITITGTLSNKTVITPSVKTLGTKVIAAGPSYKGDGTTPGTLASTDLSWFTLDTALFPTTGDYAVYWKSDTDKGTGVIAKKQGVNVSTATDVSKAVVTFTMRPKDKNSANATTFVRGAAAAANIAFSVQATDAEGNTVAPSAITGFAATLYYGDASIPLNLTPATNDSVLSYTLNDVDVTSVPIAYGAPGMRALPAGTYKVVMTATIAASGDSGSTATFSSQQTLTVSDQ